MINITNDSGNIRITDDVFTLLAGDAATSCFGVKGMAGRSKDGVNIAAVSRSIINEVSYKLKKNTGVPVKAVDVYIDTIIG